MPIKLHLFSDQAGCEADASHRHTLLRPLFGIHSSIFGVSYSTLALTSDSKWGFNSFSYSFAYPEKLLSQHFWTPSLRAELEKSTREAQRRAFTVLLSGLKKGADLERELRFIPAMAAQVR